MNILNYVVIAIIIIASIYILNDAIQKVISLLTCGNC